MTTPTPTPTPTPTTTTTTTTTTVSALKTPTLQSDWNILSASMVDRIVGSRYQLLEELGRGSYGCLFLAQSLTDNKYVAIKILQKKKNDQPEELALQQLEMDIQSDLKHPNILELYKVISDKDYIFMIMELCDQGDLFDFVIEDDEDLVKPFFVQILDAIEYMHSRNIYHRDIKLENILLSSSADDEDELICKVADFGLATRDRYSHEYGCGSTSYLPPEQFEKSNEPYDAAASDVWSLGILLLGLLFGTMPWQEASENDSGFLEFKRNPRILLDFFPDLSFDGFQFVSNALSVDPLQRPSVKQMKDTFKSIEHLYAKQDDDDNYDNSNSYDSGIFSHHGSWSDEEEEEEDIEQEKDTYLEDIFYRVKKDTGLYDDEDTDLFIHGQEKESWWL